MLRSPLNWHNNNNSNCFNLIFNDPIHFFVFASMARTVRSRESRKIAVFGNGFSLVFSQTMATIRCWRMQRSYCASILKNENKFESRISLKPFKGNRSIDRSVRWRRSSTCGIPIKEAQQLINKSTTRSPPTHRTNRPLISINQNVFCFYYLNAS